MSLAVAAPTDRRIILLILCLAVLIAQVDTSVVNLAVHAIGVGLHTPLPALQWVVDGYNLSYAALLMTGGTLADLLGRRRVLLAGAAVFVLGSLLAGLAPTITVLIAGRVLAGIGAALLLPASLALIRVIWADPHERAHAIGVWAGTNGAALAIGPTLGGWLIQTAGWRSVFLLIVPIGLAVMLWAPRAIPESSDAQGRRVDLPGQSFGGLLLAALAVAAIVHRLLLPAVGVALLAALLFVRAERRAGTGAMIPLALLRNARLAAVNGVAAAMTFGMYGVLFLLPLNWLRSGVLDATGAGLALLPMSLAFVALSHRSGPWSVRFGTRRLMAGGMALIGAGIAVLAGSNAGQILWLAEAGLLLTGVGMALNTGPVLASAVAAVEPARAGTASAMINSARMVGATLGVGVLGSVFAAGGSPPAGFTMAMSLGAGVVFAGAVLAVLAQEPVGLGARKAKKGGVDAMWRRICRPIAEAMGQKDAAAGRRTALLQPAILKSDRLLGCAQSDAARAVSVTAPASVATSMCASPHAFSAAITGCRLRPRAVRLYSTLGGTSAYTLRAIRPSDSSSRNWLVSMRWVTLGRRRRSSLKRSVPSSKW